MNVSLRIARKIDEMLQERARGELTRKADDFISGLVCAYGLVIEEPDVNRALQHALDEVVNAR